MIGLKSVHGLVMGCLPLAVVLLSMPNIWGQSPYQTLPAQGEAKRELAIEIIAGQADLRRLMPVMAAELHWTTQTVQRWLEECGQAPDGDSSLPSSWDAAPMLVGRDALRALTEMAPRHFRIEPQRETGREWLIVDVNALANTWVREKFWLRQVLAKAQGIPMHAWVGASPSASDTALARQVVVLAGLHGDVESAAAFAAAIHRKTGLATRAFRYPNDAPLRESASHLAEALQKFCFEYPECKITLVGHSMGGLVARACLELDGLSPNPAVDQLIQICPPNHGASLAEYAPLLEGLEWFQDRFRRKHRPATASPAQGHGLAQAVIDGFNEAPADLLPDSEFLRELNARERIPTVTYGVLAGNAGPIEPAIGSLVSGLWGELSSPNARPSPFERKLLAILESNELQRWKGDGVVSLESAQLPGVQDFEILPMHHLAWTELESEIGRRLVDEIAERILP